MISSPSCAPPASSLRRRARARAPDRRRPRRAPPRRFTWRRALVIALPGRGRGRRGGRSCARPSPQHQATPAAPSSAGQAPRRRRRLVQRRGDRQSARRRSRPRLADPRASATARSCRSASTTPDGVSNGVKRALQITTSLGGYPTSVHASTRRQTAATADLTLKIPRSARPGGDRPAVGARDDHRRAGRRPGPDRPG